MKVLITGASGFLGSHVAEQLKKRGDDVRCLVRKSSDKTFLESLGVELAYGAVEDRDAVGKAVEGVDAIVHSAALVKAKRPEDFVETNVDGTRNILEHALERRKSIKRFVFVSSLAAHGPSEDGTPIALDREPRPVTAYGRSKLEAERLVATKKDELPITIIRPPAVYGPRDREMFTFFQAVWRRFTPVLGDGSQTLSVVYGADAADACIRALDVDHASGSAYYVEDGNIYTQPEMADGIEKAFGKTSLRLNVPMGVVKLAAEGSRLWGRITDTAMMLTPDKVNELAAPHWVCSAAAIRKDLGWVPKTQWLAGAKKTADWYRTEHWL